MPFLQNGTLTSKLFICQGFFFFFHPSQKIRNQQKAFCVFIGMVSFLRVILYLLYCSWAMIRDCEIVINSISWDRIQFSVFIIHKSHYLSDYLSSTFLVISLLTCWRLTNWNYYKELGLPNWVENVSDELCSGYLCTGIIYILKSSSIHGWRGEKKMEMDKAVFSNFGVLGKIFRKT